MGELSDWLSGLFTRSYHVTPETAMYDDDGRLGCHVCGMSGKSSLVSVYETVADGRYLDCRNCGVKGRIKPGVQLFIR